MGKVEYQRVPLQGPLVKALHAHARKVIPPGSVIVTLADMPALGDGDPEAGEAVLHRMLKMVPGAPGAVHPDAIRALGAGSFVKGRKVLQKFLDRAEAQPRGYDSGGAVPDDDDEQIVEAGPQPKAGQTIPPVNARPMTGQAAMTALGIPDISTMTPDEQQMFALGAVPMIAGGPEAKIAEEAIPEAAQAVRQGIRAFHGSPYDFERFDLSKIGTGEGAQAYGHGIYLAENPQTAQSYKEALGRAQGAPSYASLLLTQANGDFDKAIALANSPAQRTTATGRMHADDAIAHLQMLKAGETPPLSGKMYEVNIAADPEHFLNLDLPLNQQSEHVKAVLQRGKWAGPGADDTGLEFIKGLAPKDQLQLGKEGIAGFKYLDQGSRGVGPPSVYSGRNLHYVGDQSGKQLSPNFTSKSDADAWLKNYKGPTSNYVVFDDRLIDIIKKYGIAGLVAGGLAHFKTPADQESEPQAEQHSRGGKIWYERVPLKGQRVWEPDDERHGRAP